MATGINDLLQMLWVDSAGLLLRNVAVLGGTLPLEVFITVVRTPIRSPWLLLEHSSGLLLLQRSVRLMLKPGFRLW
jgi:hypothetical protein